jgi:hypothetical protein
LGVCFQVLGAPISFWDLNGSDDVFVSALLMGLTVPSGEKPLLSSCNIVFAYILPPLIYRYQGRSSLFHPPL